MTDTQMIEKLRTMAHWTAEQPWASIADRLEELVKNEKNALTSKDKGVKI